MRTMHIKKTAMAALLGIGFAGYSFTDSELPLKNIVAVKPSNTVAIEKSVITINLKEISLENVEFDFNEAAIRSSSYQELDRVAKLLVDNKAALKISGHADNIGAYVYNWNLSKKRADAVKAYLKSKGADIGRVAATEFGDTKPVASNKTAEGRQKNRRVEMDFL
ncbi:MAG: OmpA family protein [Sphingobacteriaceae bacterium]